MKTNSILKAKSAVLLKSSVLAFNLISLNAIAGNLSAVSINAKGSMVEITDDLGSVSINNSVSLTNLATVSQTQANSANPKHINMKNKNESANSKTEDTKYWQSIGAEAVTAKNQTNELKGWQEIGAEAVTLNKPVSVSVSQPATVTKSLSITGSVSAPATVSVNNLATVSRPVSVSQPANITNVSVSAPTTVSVSNNLAAVSQPVSINQPTRINANVTAPAANMSNFAPVSINNR